MLRLARPLSELDRAAEANPLYREAIELAAKASADGDGPRAMADAVVSYADFLDKQGRGREAVSVLSNSMEKAGAALGNEHPLVIAINARYIRLVNQQTTTKPAGTATTRRAE